jgi:seryl-tRNA synthetase
MHDLKALRENPESFDRNWARRGLELQMPEILALDGERRALQTECQNLLQKRNELSKEIGILKSKGQDATAHMDQVAQMKEAIAQLESDESYVAATLNNKLATIPNLLHDSVPDGVDETGNVEVRRHGEPVLKNTALDHVAIGEKLGLLDFDTAVKLSGARFSILRGCLARLERALAQFMVDTHVNDHGYELISAPLLVKDAAMYGTGQLPKFAEDSFKTTNDYWLIPTSEVSLTNMVADTILGEGDFPLRFTAHTPCFRSEAGSAGKDTRGMIRQHQFYKVEMVSIVKPEDSEAEHERMTQCAENILKKLGLSYRVINLCAGDIGFAAQKTYDLEVWLPAQNTYREISSCSNCGAFQARRMKARFKRAGAKDTEFVHTLNGSGLAVGRALVAVLENYVNDDGSVTIPDVLRAYMNGQTKILPR